VKKNFVKAAFNDINGEKLKVTNKETADQILAA
jgi:hypothetical protein